MSEMRKAIDAPLGDKTNFYKNAAKEPSTKSS